MPAVPLPTKPPGNHRAGTDLVRATSLGKSSDCTKSCWSSPTGDCGGPLANTVYVQDSSSQAAAAAADVISSPVSSVPVTSLGCYRDSIADKALPQLLATDAAMTVDKCANMALAAGQGGWGVFVEGCAAITGPQLAGSRLSLLCWW